MQYNHVEKRKKIFYCHQCKTIIHNQQEIYFLEQESSKCFCSEKCTKKFFTPLVKYLDEEEKNFRAIHKLESDLKLEQSVIEKAMEEILSTPQEVWCDDQAETEKIYYFMGHFVHPQGGNWSLVMAVVIADGQVIYILWNTCTQYDLVCNFYRCGQKVDNSEFIPVNDKGDVLGKVPPGSPLKIEEERIASFAKKGHETPKANPEKEKTSSLDDTQASSEQIYIDPDELGIIEVKKEKMLNELMIDRDPKDIAYDDFQLYESFISTTLETPDEVYRNQDILEVDGQMQTFLTFIKTYQSQQTSFFYIVICMLYQYSEQTGEETLIPMISFPSKDHRLYFKYKKGAKKGGGLKS